MNERVFRILIALLLVGALVFVGIYLSLKIPRLVAEKAMETTVGRKEQAIDLSSVVTQIRELARLETAAMRVMNVGKVDQSYGIIPDKLAGDSITLLAVGDVIAGIDLSRITDQDVWMATDGALVLRLPPTQILVTRLDNRESRVIDRSTGLFRKSDITLEGRARQYGEQAVRREALNKGILRIAQNNAQVRLAKFLHTVGFQKVRFTSRPSPGQPQL